MHAVHALCISSDFLHGTKITSRPQAASSSETAGSLYVCAGCCDVVTLSMISENCLKRAGRWRLLRQVALLQIVMEPSGCCQFL